MLTLSPLKLLIVVIVAVVLVGPDKLPKVARQLGAGWGAFRRMRQRVEDELHDTVPDLPSAHEIARAVRSPVAFLDSLADRHDEGAPEGTQVEIHPSVTEEPTAEPPEQAVSGGPAPPLAAPLDVSLASGGLTVPDDPSMN